ncbi:MULTISPECIES: ABC transporter substrate-binding protein [Natrialbaceae]|uniref:ABC transporter substrate-binding protein n=1 Tax=Natrialbaceae TaxID=1644061 RepID=UPI00207CCEA2|nr:ABC transporter substrate-binding protein [Natronococcus sp. CG52]
MSDSTGHSIDSAEEFLTRRRMLAASSATIAGGLAGCLGGEQTGSGDAIRTFQPMIPDEMNFNTWASGYPWSQTWLLLEPVQRFFTDGSVENQMIEHWEYNPDERALTVEFEDGWHWWNGDQITAEDKYWYEECARLVHGEGSDLEDLVLEDEMTITRVYKEPQNPELVEYKLGGYLGEMMRVHRDKFRPWAEELRDASNQEERLEIEDRMADEMPLHISTVAEEGLGNGPFKIVDYSTEGIDLEFLLAEDDAVAQRLQGGDIDFGYSLLQTWVGEEMAADHVADIHRCDDTFMRRIEIFGRGPGSEHLRKREVRRAIAHAVDNRHVSNNYSAPSTAREAQTGLTAEVTSNWLDDDYVADYLEYPFEADEDGATELMERAGYELEDDRWVDEDGDRVSFEIVIPDHNTNIGRTVSDQLANFGFEIDFDVLEGATYRANTEETINFDMTVGEHGGLIAHPFYYFRHDHTHSLDMGDTGVIEDVLEEGETRAPYNGREIVIEISSNVGDEDPSGSTEEINLFELDQEWRVTAEEDRSREIAEIFSWYWNFHLPGIDLVEVRSGTFGNTRDFEFQTDTKDWSCYRGAYRGVKRGHVSPK